MSEVKGTKALELWCKRLVKDCPDVQIDNMTTSWRNGMAFCALVHHFRPDLIDLSKLDPENIYENNRLAYSIAEKHLGIPALLDPEDMVENDVPDRLSVLTYLSQFYQRLGHTVNTKVSESESKSSPSSQSTTPIKFGKVALDKCAACGLPVYLAQRLIVSQKLYHRQCFRCSKCSGHLNPKNFHVINENEFSCDTCKNEKNISKYLNNNDQMGMLAFTNDTCSSNQEILKGDIKVTRDKQRPQSILEKINMFENIDKDISIESKLGNISIKDNLYNNKYKDIHSANNISSSSTKTEEPGVIESAHSVTDGTDDKLMKKENEILHRTSPEKVYKSSIDKLNFLQTQLTEQENAPQAKEREIIKPDIEDDLTKSVPKNDIISLIDLKSNITDDSRLAQSTNKELDTELIKDNSHTDLDISTQKETEVKINVPPRRKKNSAFNKKIEHDNEEKIKKSNKDYPEDLNPFSDEEDEPEPPSQRRVSTNPFGSSDEEDDAVPPIASPPKIPDVQSSTPIKRHITAYNPFWSDGEEPSSDEEYDSMSSMHKSPITASTPNLPSSTPRRRKPKAPPPPVISISEHHDMPATSMDDVASLSSMSSHTSTAHSDQKSFGKLTPNSKKKRPAPTPLDSLSTVSGCGGSLERGVDTSGTRSNLSDSGRKTKGPAPGLPLPERREVKMQMSPEELQVQLDLLETQQLGLERQGVLIEQMIRDKCEGDEASMAPQEEIEDLVIQLCELVNEKNDLFRKQTELMYIRRQQRLEQEQADIEHEIRVIQSRPAVNRIDADKAREEHLVCRLVEIVRMRDELVQQIDAERRRERQEDLAIAASIASKRAQRNSDSNSSSIKSTEVVTPVKKNKVKDKVKKQLKKAKHTLISKKKDEEKKDKTT
ncbi:MICAL-like protein 1 isoform X1 [Colias croceus]|uniref:MICAL-like protein 1 isoform X1 n=1 Tax=Colias crocea TaxID=72248 RepID=UPI001E27B6CA|nr:MICAL-like protein 1 isoform X1 [Colias croceus]